MWNNIKKAADCTTRPATQQQYEKITHSKFTLIHRIKTKFIRMAAWLAVVGNSIC